jgi:predicted transcriptional regulator of viral defense system
MLNTTEKLLQADFGQRVIHDSDVGHLFGGSDARRYALVNKALTAKELIRLRRGLYVISSQYNPAGVNEYYIANQMVPYSFVTAETALSFHGWIPEKVVTFISMAPFGRSKTFATPFGKFIYRVSSITNAEFLKGVRRIEMGKQGVLIATPLRALLDYVYWHTSNNINLEFLQESLRIELDDLLTLTQEQFVEVQQVYPQQRMKKFLTNLEKEVIHAASTH